MPLIISNSSSLGPISRVTVDSSKMKVAEIVEPLADKPHEEMSATDYKVTRVELGKKMHEVVKHDAQYSVASLVQRYDELLAKKDKLEEDNRQLVAAVRKITKPTSEVSNPSSSTEERESIQGVVSAAQKVQALESWVDQLHNLCAQVLKEVFQMMVKFKTIEEQLNQVSDTFIRNLEKVEDNLTIWLKIPQQKLSVLLERQVIPSRVVYLEYQELLEKKALVLKSLIEYIDDAMRLRMEVFQDMISHCQKASCTIMGHDGELLVEEKVLSDLLLKIRQEWKSEPFSTASIEALVTYKVTCGKVSLPLREIMSQSFVAAM